MMKRFLGCVLSCAILLSMVTLAVAQSPPTPVTRLGDWVEVGNEVYINFIASTRIHYQWTDNYDFESDIQDRVASRSNTSTVPHDGDGDLSFQESRLSLDLRYQKNLRARILLENQMTWDGNRIDNGFDLDGDSPATQTFRDGNNLSCRSASAAEGSPQPVSSSCLQRNTGNLERAWIEYTFPGTPITFDVGARIRSYDPGRMLGDDDPGIRVVTRFGPTKSCGCPPPRLSRPNRSGSACRTTTMMSTTSLRAPTTGSRTRWA